MSALDDLVASVDEQTAAIDAELADPTARLRAASAAMKRAAGAAIGFSVLGTIIGVVSISGGFAVSYTPFEGAPAIAVSDVLSTKEHLLSGSVDSGTGTVSVINSPGVTVSTVAAGGWNPVEGRLIGIAS